MIIAFNHEYISKLLCCSHSSSKCVDEGDTLIIEALRISDQHQQVSLFVHYIDRGGYMSAHVCLNLLNELRKKDKIRGLLSILSLFATS